MVYPPIASFIGATTIWHASRHSKTHLDHELKVSLVVIERGGGVRAHDVLAVNVGLDRNVLADGEAERVRVVGQREAVAGRLAVY